MPTPPERLDRAIAMTERLIAFDTTSRNSNLALIEDVKSYLGDLGIAARLTYDDDGGKANLWCTIGPEERGGIVLSGHTDVVPVDGQEWTTDPFSMVRKDGRLYGRGTCDMKAFVAIALSLAPEMAAAKLNVPIHFAFSYDEEVGCIGVQRIVDDVVANLPLPRAVIVGEPTEMKLIGGNKGTRIYRTRVTGVPGHSSDPRHGANAVTAAARMISFIEDLGDEIAAKPLQDSPFDPPYTTLTVGVIEGGTAHNIIPEFCDITWGMRVVPDDDADVYEQRIRDYCTTALEPKLKAVAPHTGFEHHKLVDSVGLRPDHESAAETLVRQLTGLNRSSVVSFGTEAGTFQRAGMPAVIFGPGSIDQAHKADEFIAIDQISQCVDFMVDLIEWAKTAE
ncbi:MAG: acetylornithine deacetylase [Alphaproteobacteria bacterium]|nr:acetylornithine deacetylase [Alphaproteobacteria bacterium]